MGKRLQLAGLTDSWGEKSSEAQLLSCSSGSAAADMHRTGSLGASMLRTEPHSPSFPGFTNTRSAGWLGQDGRLPAQVQGSETCTRQCSGGTWRASGEEGQSRYGVC